jgi:hypothetical protein
MLAAIFPLLGLLMIGLGLKLPKRLADTKGMFG